ncbi:MAG TPA: glycosyltransferase family 4 protein [Solirubrobacteraceae bacterium]
MRIAVVRGANLNAWELSNFHLPGHEVVAIGSRRGAFDAHGVPVGQVRLRSPADVVARLPFPLPAVVARFGGEVSWLFGLERALRGFDVAHVAELSSPYSLQALRARDAGAVGCVVATVWENIALAPVANALVARRVAEVAAGVDRFLAVTERAREHLRYAGVEDDRIEVLPMGVDVERFAPVERGASDELRVLCVSRLVPEKGVEDLVVALGMLVARGVPASVTFAGEGPARARLEQLAAAGGVSDRVRFAGLVPYEAMPSLHASADVFVLASAPRATWQEQFGFAVVEAMASGLPVLAGDSGSLDEVVGDRAQLVVPHKPDRLADALEALAADPERRRRLGEANRARTVERYDRRRVAVALEAFYERSLSTASRRAPITRQS